MIQIKTQLILFVHVHVRKSVTSGTTSTLTTRGIDTAHQISTLLFYLQVFYLQKPSSRAVQRARDQCGIFLVFRIFTFKTHI